MIPFEELCQALERHRARQVGAPLPPEPVVAAAVAPTLPARSAPRPDPAPAARAAPAAVRPATPPGGARVAEPSRPAATAAAEASGVSLVIEDEEATSIGGARAAAGMADEQTNELDISSDDVVESDDG